MKNRFLILLFLLPVLFLLAAHHRPVQKQTRGNQQQKTPLESYTYYWNRVDSLAKKGLKRSALEVVRQIHDKASRESNAAQLVKSVIHELKYQDDLEEGALKKNISDVQQEIRSAGFPVQPVLHSMLAEMYRIYYQQNRYRFLNRTETIQFRNDDIDTWDLRRIVDATLAEYRLSLQEAARLKKIQVDIFDEVVVKGNTEESRRFRPTLYDFLAHRALDYYMNEETGLTEPADHFEFNSAFYIADAEMFLNIMLRTSDTTNLHYRAIALLQDLIDMHENDAHPGARIDVDLLRLKFVHQHLTIPTNDSLYSLRLQEIADRYKEYPGCTEALLELARMAYQSGMNYQQGKNEQVRMLLLKAESYCTEAISRFPYSQGGLGARQLKEEINGKSISFSVGRVNTPGQAFLARLDYRNVAKVYFRIVTDDGSLPEDPYGEERLRHYLKLTPVQSWSVSLPADSDKQSHAVEIAMPALPFGKYMIVVSANEDFTFSKNGMAYASCRISKLSVLNRKQPDGSDLFQVLDRENGNPLPGVTASVTVRQYDYRTRKYEVQNAGTYLSDADGRVIIPVSKDYRNYNIEFILGNDHLAPEEYFYQYKRPEETGTEINRLFLFTDRAIYRPGQLIYFKGISLRGAGEHPEPLTGKKIHVDFFDVNGEKISGQDFVTNEYGTIQGTFTAPQGILTGQMRIGNDDGTCYFSVEEYKRPRFEVTYLPVKGAYRVREKITVQGQSMTYSGVPVDRATVKYRVVRTARFPDWFYYRRAFFPPASEMEIYQGTTESNDSGVFKISFDALPDLTISPKDQPVFNYRIHADVTDQNGETRSEEMNLSAGYASVILNTNIPDELNAEERNSCYLQSENLSSQPVPFQGTVSVHLLNDPGSLTRKRLWTKPDRYVMTPSAFKEKFPLDVYGNEDDVSTWTLGKEILSAHMQTDRDSILPLNLKSMQAGKYRLDVKGKDVNGQDVFLQKYFTVYRPSSSDLPLTTFDWYTMMKDDALPGENDKVLIGSSADHVKMLYEIESKNKIVYREWIDISRNQKLLEIPVKEEYRGNFAVHFSFVKNGRVYIHTQTMKVPWDNKELVFTYSTFRSKLTPGEPEQWKINISGKQGGPAAAEMLACMYDASLDQFTPHAWDFSIYNRYYPSLGYSTPASGYSTSQVYEKDWNQRSNRPEERTYDQLNWFWDMDFTPWRSRGRYNPAGIVAYDEIAAPSRAVDGVQTNAALSKDAGAKQADANLSTAAHAAATGGPADVRRNLNETAFFYPQLNTDEKGDVSVSFTSPDALTRWRFMALAHTKDLRYGYSEKEIVTQKQVMLIPNAPRFLREGDRVSFPVKINSLSDSLTSGTVTLHLFDAFTMQPVDGEFGNDHPVKNITAWKNQSANVSWDLTVPEKYSAIVYRVTATLGSFSDGEEQSLPVLSNRQLVTESMPLWTRSGQSKTFELDKLIHQQSATLRNHKLTLEYTSNPAWLAVQALPYMMEYPFACSEQIFSRYYANALATSIANSNPRLKAVFESWKSSSPQAFLSSLEKNPELKSLVMEETPWVAEAKDESERKKRIGTLFDLNRMSQELNTNLNQLQQAQSSNGGWPWFSGMPEDRYITQYIVTGLGRLDHLGVQKTGSDPRIRKMTERAIQYLDARMQEDYERETKEKNPSKAAPPVSVIQYMYARSYIKDFPLPSQYSKAYNYYYTAAKAHWTAFNEYEQGMIALVAFRQDDMELAHDIIGSLKENALHHPEMGMYWKNNAGGYFWYQAPVETQSLLIEAFDEIMHDTVAVEDMKVWLLKQKQTQDWKTTKATADACYALLMHGTSWIAEEPAVDISLGNKRIELKNRDLAPEAGTGYFKTSWNGDEITRDMGKVSVSQSASSGGGISWGAVYWQYFEDLDKITPHQTPLNLKKELFVERPSKTGPVIVPLDSTASLNIGDRVIVRIELRVDRAMEYVHMKDQRASGLEPEQVLSEYHWQDGLGYYESTRDAATNFFFGWLPKGTFVFEYPLRAAQAGNFSNGITLIESMYAPEFSAHSEGRRIVIMNR